MKKKKIEKNNQLKEQEIQKRIDANPKYKVAQICTCYSPEYDMKDGSLKHPLLSISLLMEEIPNT